MNTFERPPMVSTTLSPMEVLGSRYDPFVEWYRQKTRNRSLEVIEAQKAFFAKCLDDLATEGYVPGGVNEYGQVKWLVRMKCDTDILFESEDHPEFGPSLSELKKRPVSELSRNVGIAVNKIT